MPSQKKMKSGSTKISQKCSSRKYSIAQKAKMLTQMMARVLTLGKLKMIQSFRWRKFGTNKEWMSI